MRADASYVFSYLPRSIKREGIGVVVVVVKQGASVQIETTGGQANLVC